MSDTFLNILYSPSPPGVPEIVLSLDAEKAFDWLEWGYLFSTYCGSDTSPMADVRTNNNLSLFFEFKRGSRQRCPMLPLLLAVAMEPLALALR